MKTTVILFILAFVLPVGAANICGTILSTPNFERYLDAIHPSEMHPLRIQQVIPRTEFVLSRFLISRGINLGEISLFKAALVEFQLAVGAHNRNWFILRDQRLNQLAKMINLKTQAKLGPTDFMSVLENLKNDSELEEAIAVAPFVLSEQTSILKFFLLGLYHEPSRSTSFGPREMSLLREIFQYAHIHAGDRALQVGTQSPSVLAALKSYLPHVNVTGFREGPWSAAEEDWLANFKVSTFSGKLDEAKSQDKLLGGKDWFRLIFALDSTATKFSLSDFLPYLARHGSIVIINDYDLPPPFTKAEVASAGLQVLSWARDRSLPAKVAEVLYGPNPPERSGQLRAYVLRWGDEDVNRRPSTIDRHEAF